MIKQKEHTENPVESKKEMKTAKSKKEISKSQERTHELSSKDVKKKKMKEKTKIEKSNKQISTNDVKENSKDNKPKEKAKSEKGPSKEIVLPKFIEPPLMCDGDLYLFHTQFYIYEDYIEYQWEMVNPFNYVMGEISLCLGENQLVKMFFGNVGYEVDRDYRGCRYAARSVRLLFPFIRRHGVDSFIICCDPNNYASRRTCELSGARLIEILDIPQNCELYKRGHKYACRYMVDIRNVKVDEDEVVKVVNNKVVKVGDYVKKVEKVKKVEEKKV